MWFTVPDSYAEEDLVQDFSRNYIGKSKTNNTSSNMSNIVEETIIPSKCTVVSFTIQAAKLCNLILTEQPTCTFFRLTFSMDQFFWVNLVATLNKFLCKRNNNR